MNNLESIQKRIFQKDDKKLINLLHLLRFKDQKIVFTNGVFDLLHRGHVDYLSRAADLGDVLIVGLNTDRSVKRLGKGDARPIQDEKTRAILLAAMRFVDYVVLFDEETPYDLIEKIKPDVLVKGGDYKIEEIVGADLVLARNGEVKTLDFLPGFSTTNIEKKIKNP